eukprot:1286090-Rhodomonas_salina.3
MNETGLRMSETETPRMKETVEKVKLMMTMEQHQPPLSPRSEVTRLRAVVAVKDACLLNFSKT